MRKTLLVTNDFPPHLGGIETFLEGFAHQLDPNQLVVYTSSRARDGITDYDASTPWTTYRDPTRILLPTPTTRRRMEHLIRKHRIENVWFGASVPLALLSKAARKAGARTIITSTHGDEITWTATSLGRAALRSAFRNADVVTYISRAMLGRLRPYIPTETTTMHLPGGITPEDFHLSSSSRAQMREQFSLADATPIVVCVGRLIPGKGQDMLIKAWEQVHRLFPDARLMIVGSGPYEKKIVELVRECTARDSIILTGAIPHTDIASYYQFADIFAMPCRERLRGLSAEGLGITYLEAAASALPVIVGRSGGAPETVIDGETGYVVDGTNGDDIARNLIDLISDPDKAKAMGERGRKWVRKSWTWHNLAQPLLEMLS